MDPITFGISQGAAGAAGGEALYVDDVFSTYLYDGTGSSQTITNGIDLAGEGGLVWLKKRSSTGNHWVFDTERGASSRLLTNTNGAAFTSVTGLSFNSNGFTVNSDSSINASGEDHVMWTFRKAPGFFDVVTYTGDQDINRTVSHSLGSVPGMIIVKEVNNSGDWYVWHRELGGTGKALVLNSTASTDTNSNLFSTLPTASVFSPGDNTHTNQLNQTYVAYIFAHDDQSFGTNEDESIIKCGSYTTNSSGVIPDVNLGFEPQWLLIKNTSNSAQWYLYDSMRGVPVGSNEETLYPNLTNAAVTGANTVELTSTGFTGGPDYLASGADTFIYMAIRRPHKPPTAATEVFAVTEDTTATSLKSIDISFPTDFAIQAVTEAGQKYAYSRLTGNSYLRANSPDAESALSAPFSVEFDQQNTFTTYISDQDNVFYNFRRAPGFFDVVTYTGVSATVTVNHNLKVVPELIIVKSRDGQRAWPVMFNFRATLHDWISGLNSNAQAYFDRSYSSQYAASQPTSTSISFTAANDANVSGENFIAYLFASLDGISKVGSYSGTGNNIDVDCGFTAGARFVLIKRTDSTGDWYVWDTERGIVSGNDPYFLINSTAAEVTTTDYIDPLNAGFTVTSTAPDALNASGGTYIFLAIA